MDAQHAVVISLSRYSYSTEPQKHTLFPDLYPWRSKFFFFNIYFISNYTNYAYTQEHTTHIHYKLW